MPTSTPNAERPSTRQGDYNPAESNGEYKLLQLQELVANKAYETITEFLAKQSEYEIASLLKSFPSQNRLLIWAQVPEDHIDWPAKAKKKKASKDPEKVADEYLANIRALLGNR